jgi:hypothetical protein
MQGPVALDSHCLGAVQQLETMACSRPCSCVAAECREDTTTGCPVTFLMPVPMCAAKATAFLSRQVMPAAAYSWASDVAAALAVAGQEHCLLSQSWAEGHMHMACTWPVAVVAGLCVNCIGVDGKTWPWTHEIDDSQSGGAMQHITMP